MPPIRSQLAAITLALLAHVGGGTPCLAGIGSENLIVVVNGDSADSRTVANHYVALRQIPSDNVVVLRNVPSEPVTTLEKFRVQILKPLLEEIERRGLAPQTCAVAYSAGFPFGVRIDKHRDRLTDANLRKMFTPVASINGVTYFFRYVLADREGYLSPTANLYARMPWERHFANPFIGEDAESFDAANEAVKKEEHAEAATAFSELFDKHPTQPPLAILAAEALARSGDGDAAIAHLRKAADAQWSSGSSLQKNEAFASLADRDEFQQLVSQLGDAPHLTQHAVGFDSTRGWTPNGWWSTPERGVTYLPAFVLAVTEGEGTTRDEAIEYLQRAVAADHSYPDGTVYFTLTGDVRTKTRLPQFPEAVLHLKWLGIGADIVRDTLPRGKPDCLGVTLGSANFSWASSGSTLLPGALGDNLTSTGGALTSRSQTKLSELLRAGAAAASGTVTEPYALQFKFPLPLLHAFYAEGVTAIEAFYLSVTSPYQLLIVGDPLCQPFARPPREQVVSQIAQVEGTPSLLLQTRLPNDDQANDDQPSEAETQGDDERATPLSEVHFYIDGRLRQKTPPKEMYRLLLGGVAGGAYELRTVLIGDRRLAPSKAIITWIDAEGLLPTPTASVVTGSAVAAANQPDEVVISLAAPGADMIRLMHHREVVDTLKSDEGQITFAAGHYGEGPVRLRPIATYRGTEIPGREITVEQ